MAVRLSKEIIQQRLTNDGRGIQIVGEYTSSNVKTDFRCVKGHVWKAKPSDLNQGKGCPECAGVVRLTKEDVQRTLNEDDRGIKIIGQYQGTNKKTLFECTYGHRWNATPKNVKGGTSCPVCFGKVPLSSEAVQQYLNADGRGFKILGKYINARTNTKFKCSNGHEWIATPSSVLNRTGCKVCSGKARLTKEIVQRRLDESGRGIKIIGEYISTHKKSTFECDQGHQWEAEPNSVMGGNGCKVCAGQVPLTIDDVCNRLNKAGRGIRIVGDFVNTTIKTIFECRHGHRWAAKPNNVFNGKCCPHCAKYGAPSDNDIIYIWMLDDCKTYKFGITSQRLGFKRIDKVSTKHGFEANILFFKRVTGKATVVEAQLKRIGQFPEHIAKRDGHTEFRIWTDQQLGQAIDIINAHAVPPSDRVLELARRYAEQEGGNVQEFAPQPVRQQRVGPVQLELFQAAA